jgi:hypothetical protein
MMQLSIPDAVCIVDEKGAVIPGAQGVEEIVDIRDLLTRFFCQDILHASENLSRNGIRRTARFIVHALD